MSSALPPPQPDDEVRHGARRTQPNYAVRRAVVAGGALLVTAVAVATAVIAFRGTGDDDGRAGISTTWDSIALVERTTGAVRVLDEDGQEIATIRGTGPVDAVHSAGDRLALVGPSQVALVGLDGGEPVLVPIEPGSMVTELTGGSGFTLAVGTAGGGNVTLIDASDGTLLDVGATAEQTSPMLLPDSIRSDDEGRAFAIGDGRNFQTVVVRFGEADATFFPDVPMAVADDLVVTSQTVGSSAELGLFDPSGARLATMPTEHRPVGGIVSGDRFVFVTDGGVVYSASVDDEAPQRRGVIVVPEGDSVQSVAPAFDGTRLVVGGARFQAVVDPDGTTLYQAPFATPTTPLRPTVTWRCLPVGGSGAFTLLVDLDSGDALADLQSADVTAVSRDGCGVEVVRAGTRSIVTAAGTTALPAAVATTWIAPDASAAVLVDNTSSASLVRLEAGDDDDDDGADGVGEPIALGGVDGFVAFLDR